MKAMDWILEKGKWKWRGWKLEHHPRGILELSCSGPPWGTRAPGSVQLDGDATGRQVSARRHRRQVFIQLQVRMSASLSVQPKKQGHSVLPLSCVQLPPHGRILSFVPRVSIRGSWKGSRSNRDHCLHLMKAKFIQQGLQHREVMKMPLSFALQAEAHLSPPEPLMMPKSRLASIRKATS